MLVLTHPLILRHSARAEWLEWRKGWLQTERRLPPPECLRVERTVERRRR